MPGADGKLLVSEVFGPTIQGEGPSMGRAAMFIRLGLCNLDCAWCDTPYTWDWDGKNGPPQDRDALTPMSVLDVADLVYEATLEADVRLPHLYVVTGGEPMLHSNLADLCEVLSAVVDVEVETNGTIVPSARLACFVSRFNVSPKLRHSGVPQHRAWRDAALHEFVALAVAGKAAFKFVVADPDDVDEVCEFVAEFDVPRSAVWLMPEGRSSSQVRAGFANIVPVALREGFNVSSRLHVELWEDCRGV